MAQFVIPSIFTAIDRFTAPVKKMTTTSEAFSSKTADGVNKVDAAFNKLSPSLSDASKQLLNFASAAAIMAGVVSTIRFGFESMKDYESNLAQLRAITGATGAQFEGFKKQIEAVANTQKVSAVEVASAFTVIGNAQPELLKSAEGLSAVTDATMKLAKASRSELEPTAMAMVTMMNQFRLGANDAAASAEILATAERIGSSSITKTSEALSQFGVVAKNMGVGFRESVSMVQTISQFELGAEAGTKLRNILINMGSAKVLDKLAVSDMKRLGINMDIVSNKALPLSDRLREMSKAAKDNSAIFHIFGKENNALATALLNNVDNFDKMYTGLGATGNLLSMVDENMNTLTAKIEQMKASFVNFLVTGDKTNIVLDTMKGFLKFVADNMKAIVTGGVFLIGSLVSVKIAFALARGAVFAYNFWLGITAGTQAVATGAIAGNSVALMANKLLLYGVAAATSVATAAQWLLNAAMAANPIGATVLALVGLVALIGIAIAYFDDFGATLLLLLGPIGWIVSAFMSIKNNWDNIVKAFENDGIWAGIKMIGASLLDFILKPLEQILTAIAYITGADWAKSAVAGLHKFRADIGINTGDPEAAKQVANAPVGVERLNPSKSTSEMLKESIITSIQTQKVSVDLNLPKGMTAEVKQNKELTPVKIGSTNNYGVERNPSFYQ